MRLNPRDYIQKKLLPRRIGEIAEGGGRGDIQLGSRLFHGKRHSSVSARGALGEVRDVLCFGRIERKYGNGA